MIRKVRSGFSEKDQAQDNILKCYGRSTPRFWALGRCTAPSARQCEQALDVEMLFDVLGERIERGLDLLAIALA
jgi:hypothetical protein